MYNKLSKRRKVTLTSSLIFDILGADLLGELLSPNIDHDWDAMLRVQKEIEDATSLPLGEVIRMIESIPLGSIH